MGKKSLIKSTTKKKAGAKVEEKTTKKAAAKKTKKTTAKSTKKTATKTTKKSAASTTKKSSATTAKKKAAPAAKKPAAKKATPKKTTSKKTTGKKATTSKAKVATKKAAPKKAKAPKKLSVKELVFKKFEPVQALPEIKPAPKPAVVQASAPPIITTTDPDEADRLRTLLFTTFDMQTIKASAIAPTTPPVVEEPVNQPGEAAQPQADSAYITVEPHETEAASDPVDRTVKIALAAAAVVVFLLLAISYNNSSKYYISPKDNAIEIWKGRFSPKDTQFFMVLHGTSVVEPIKATYTKNEVFPLVFDYYINKADTLLEVPGLPDFEGIKVYLHQAEDYSVTTEMAAAVTARLNNIERMILLYKADVAISKDTDEALASAIKLLKKAGKLTPSAAQAEEITQKIERSRERRIELKSTPKE